MALHEFRYQKTPGQVCPFCSNSCNRTLVTFNDGTSYITGNRCERGEILGDPDDPETRKRVAETNRRMQSVPDMVKLHNRLLAKEWPHEVLCEPRGIQVGIPRVLEFWSSLPFWKTMFSALGFDVVVSKRSDYELFERGLPSIPSDTACLPAKVTHGHIADLVRKRVDRIFMPMMISQPTENPSIKGRSFCALIQGYPMVLDRSDDPLGRHGIPLDHPVFHWDTPELKESQVVDWFHSSWGVSRRIARQAYRQAEAARLEFHAALRTEGEKILSQVEKEGSFAVVLAGRPYHSDELVNHQLSTFFTGMGIPVITLDGLPLDREDLSRVRMDTINSYHARVLSAAKLVARSPHLELVQIVSFGCGHEATLTDEMLRLLKESSDKEALVVKLDEGEVKGPLNIRVKSFIETVRVKRKHLVLGRRQSEETEEVDPFQVKFTRKDARERTILVPNLSPAFSLLIAKMFEKEGYRTRQLPLADRRAVELGKKYVHNDICYPAQVNIGEALAVLDRGDISPAEAAVGLAKNCEHCRAGQYVTLARKALDEAGYAEVPIITSGKDDKDMHPGFRLSSKFRIRMAFGMALMDGIEQMVRAVRPYELHPGMADEVYQKHLHWMMDAFKSSRSEGVLALREAVRAFNAIPVDRSVRKPRVAVLGEILMKYHPSANCNVEQYLETNGMEVVQPPMLDFFRMDDVVVKDKVAHGFSSRPFLQGLVANISDGVFRRARARVDEVMRGFRFYERFPDISELVEHTTSFIPRTYAAGEAWLIPAEILHQAEKGVNSFVIVQPFGCLPNHITGRGMTKTVKQIVPHVQVLSLDYDPDTSVANVENRLQMLIISARELEKSVRREPALA